MIEDLLIPYDRDGNMLHHAYKNDPTITWKESKEFVSTLKYKTHRNKASGAYFIFERVEDGTKVPMFVHDFSKLIPYLFKGKMNGKWRPIQRGRSNYGIILVTSNGE